MDSAKQIEIAEYLNGTCKGAYEAAEAFNVTEDEVLEAVVAQEIECCEICGWWNEIADMQDGKNDEQICQQCADDEDED